MLPFALQRVIDELSADAQTRLALEIVFEGAGGGALPDMGAIRGLQSDGNCLLVAGLVRTSLSKHVPG